MESQSFKDVPLAHPALNYPILKLPPVIQDAALAANRKLNLGLVEGLRQNAKKVFNQGGAKAQELALVRGQLLARDRMSLLLDQDSPFLELCTFAGYGQKDCTPSGSVIGGIGLVS